MTGHRAAESGDYYYENGMIVMTRAFLLKSGYCCGSGCRHCPYNHENCPEKKDEAKRNRLHSD